MADPTPGQFFDAEGKPLAGEALQEAWKSGSAHVAAGQAVHMLDENGDLRLVPAEHVAAARAKGFAPAPAEVVEQHALQREHGGLGGQIATAAESAADMATVGGYGYAAGKLSPEYAKALLARREANPLSHVAGSVAGLAPSLLAGTGEADVAELGVKAAEGADVAHGVTGAAEAGQAAEAAPGLASQALGAANTVAAAPLKAVGAVGGIVERGIKRGLASLGADGSTLAGRMATKALATGGAGAAEGAVFGVGQELSDSSLEGRDLTSEGLVASIGRNALFGGALGAGMGAIGELGSAAVNGILPDSDKLAKFGREQGMRAIGANGKDLQKLGDKFDMTADELMGYEAKADGASMKKGERMFSAASNAKEMAENLAQAASETGAAKRGITEEIDHAIQSNPEVAAVAQPDVGEFFARVKSEVLDKLAKSDVMADRRLAKTVEREFAPLRESYDAVQKFAADQAAGIPAPKEVSVNTAFDPESMRPESAKYVRENAATLGPPRIEIYPDGMGIGDGRHRMQAAYERGERSMQANVVHYDAKGNKLSEAVEPISLTHDLGAPPVSVATKAPIPVTFARLDEFEQRLGKRIYGENVKGAGITVAPKGAKQLEKVRAILSSFQDETAQKALAAMGEDSGQFATLNRQYSTLSNLKKIADRTAGRMNANRMASPTDHALGMGGMLLSMLSGNVGALAATAIGGGAAIANKLLRERGNSVLADIAYRTSKMDHLLENTAHALSMSPERLAQPIEAAEQIAHHKAREKLADSSYVPLGIKALSKDYDDTSKRVQAMTDPAAQQAQLTVASGPIGQHYPEQAAAMNRKLVAMHQHLIATMPQPVGGSPVSPLASQPRVAPREMARYLSRVNAALHPERVIKDIGAGRLDQDAVDTFKQLYPASFAKLQRKTLQLLATNKGQIPFPRLVHISAVLGIEGDSSLGPRLAGIQQSIAQISAPPPRGTPPGAPGKPKRGNPGVSKLGTSFALPGQASPGAHQ